MYIVSYSYNDCELGMRFELDKYVVDSMKATEERKKIIQEKMSHNIYATVRSIDINKVEIQKHADI